jgi:MFS transporter, FSR family, fosmidomycin resistance protein
MLRLKKSNPVIFGLLFGGIHLLVDMVTVSTAFAVANIYHVPLIHGISVVILYDILAFAGQPVIGWLSDRKEVYRATALVGILLTAVSVPVLPVFPLWGLALTGLGNACFHVGAGALSLCVTPGRATVPGIFVAPGAIGLGLGTLMGRGGTYVSWAFVIAMGISLLLILLVPMPGVSLRPKKVLLPPLHATWIVSALLLSIVIRALVGFGGSYNCTKTFAIKIGLMSVAVLGKGLGGVVSDRIGWIPGSVGALFISAPLIAFGGSEPLWLLAGFLFFQMTMPVTLVAVTEVMPGRPGLAFGLCCLALLAGALLAFSGTVQSVYSSFFFLVLILFSATLIWVSLKGLRGKIPMKF